MGMSRDRGEYKRIENQQAFICKSKLYNKLRYELTEFGVNDPEEVSKNLENGEPFGFEYVNFGVNGWDVMGYDNNNDIYYLECKNSYITTKNPMANFSMVSLEKAKEMKNYKDVLLQLVVRHSNGNILFYIMGWTYNTIGTDIYNYILRQKNKIKNKEEGYFNPSYSISKLIDLGCDIVAAKKMTKRNVYLNLCSLKGRGKSWNYKIKGKLLRENDILSFKEGIKKYKINN